MTIRKWQSSTDPWDVIADEDREEAIRKFGRLPAENGQKVAVRMKNAKTGKLTPVTWSTTAAPDGEGGVIGIWTEGTPG